MHCSRNCRRRQHPFGNRRESLERYVAPLETGYLTLCFFGSNFIARSYSYPPADRAFPRQPGNCCPSTCAIFPWYVDKRFLASLHLVGIHFGAFIHLLHRVVGTEQRPWEFPADV